MSSNINSNSFYQDFSNLLDVQSGGLDGSNTTESLSNIDAFHLSEIGTFSKPAKLLSNSKIPDNAIPGASNSVIANIKGPITVSTGSSNSYVITNYNAFSSYSVHCDKGSVSIAGDTITYIAPNTGNEAGFTINERTITLGLTTSTTFSPMAISNLTGTDRIDQRLPLSIISTGGVPSISDTFQGIHVDIRKASDNSIVINKLYLISENAITVNLNSYTVNVLIDTLSDDTVYNVKVRSKNLLSGYSSYSPPKSFTTKLATIINTPIIESPVNNSVNFTTSKDTVISASAFSNAVGNSEYYSTEWMISKDNTFTNLYYHLTDSTLKDSITGKSILLTPLLEFNTIYYFKVRHCDKDGVVSNWSPIVTVTTSSVPTITTPVISNVNNISTVTDPDPYPVVINSSDYSISNLDGGTHDRSNWKYSSNIDFSNSIDLGWSSDKTTIKIPVSKNGTIYVMVRYESSKGLISSWSNVATIKNT